MANYGFAIDLRKCIGCHACTIACKAEHEIPVGVNRCWVKTVEKGSFPETQRFFFPVLCNQCDDAPCVRICPTNALFKRRDGIVDLNGDSCIGCRACMEACPYDQLFIDPNTHTAEKCNFCANRVENKLLPACVSVCPTECRIFGDLDDPASEVVAASCSAKRSWSASRRRARDRRSSISARKRARSGRRRPSRPFYYKEGQVHLRPIGAPGDGSAQPGRSARRLRHAARQAVGHRHGALSVHEGGLDRRDVARRRCSGCSAIAGRSSTIAAPAISIVFIGLTAVVLVVDLERPERFYYILTRSNWRRGWCGARGSSPAHGLVSSLWFVAGWLGWHGALTLLAVPAIVRRDPGDRVHGLPVRAGTWPRSVAGTARCG